MDMGTIAGKVLRATGKLDAMLLGSGAADPLYRRSVRVSMGHVLRLPFAHLDGGYTMWQRSLQVSEGETQNMPHGHAHGTAV